MPNHAESGGSPHPRGPHLLLYDGGCGLCHSLVQFLLAHDRHGRFHFAALQGPTAARVLAAAGLDASRLSTVFVVPAYQRVRQAPLTKSRAVLFAASALGWPWRALRLFGWLPTPLLDRAYDFIAARRRRVFGDRATCVVPTPAERERFVDVEGDSAAMAAGDPSATAPRSSTGRRDSPQP